MPTRRHEPAMFWNMSANLICSGRVAK
jgi:hypothetical protein